MRRHIALSAALLLLICLLPSGPREAQSGKTGFFTVKQERGRWWFVDGQGQRFFSTGVNEISAGRDPRAFEPDKPESFGLRFFENHDAWWRSTSRRLREWGFNTAGGWTDDRVLATRDLPYVVSLQLGKMVGAPWADVGTPESLAIIRPLVERVAAYKDDSLLIGYFIDNELDWYDDELFTYWARPDSSDRIKARWWTIVEEAYRGDLRAFLADFDVTPRPSTFESLKGELELVEIKPGRRPQVLDGFTEWLAGDYYRVLTTEVRRVDPNHLILGDRYANNYSQAVARAAGSYLDVVSVNYDAFEPSGWISPAFFDTLSRLTGKPLLVTELYAAAMENRSGNLNTQGPFMVVGTQRERAAVVGVMTEQLARLPSIVGYHWFRWSDQLPTGRFNDGEDFNMGLVDLNDRPYEALTATFARANGSTVARHEQGPSALGLSLTGGVWDVPPAVSSTTADWANAKLFGPSYWIPRTDAASPWLPFGDFYVAWQPEGLFFGAAYQDHFRGGGDSTTLPDRQQLVLTVASETGSPQPLVLVGMGESESVPATRTGAGSDAGASGDEEGALKKLVLHTATGIGASRLNGIVGTQRADGGLDQALQVFVPASVLGARQLASGTRLKLGVSLVMRGGAKEMFWPSPGRMATIRLGGRPQ